MDKYKERWNPHTSLIRSYQFAALCQHIPYIPYTIQSHKIIIACQSYHLKLSGDHLLLLHMLHSLENMTHTSTGRQTDRQTDIQWLHTLQIYEHVSLLTLVVHYRQQQQLFLQYSISTMLTTPVNGKVSQNLHKEMSPVHEYVQTGYQKIVQIA